MDGCCFFENQYLAASVKSKEAPKQMNPHLWSLFAEVSGLLPLVLPPVASEGEKLCLNRSESEGSACVYLAILSIYKAKPQCIVPGWC